MATAKEIAHITPEEEALLQSPARPIVLVPQRSDAKVAWQAVAPNNHYVGIMLPYAPVHEVWLPAGAVWVMTSGNRSGEPVIFKDEEAISQLKHVADYFLVHNRRIVASVDDSVVQVVKGETLQVRRSRGYVPTSFKVRLPNEGKKTILAMGGDLKNAFAMNRDEAVLMGPHIGDLANMAMNDSLVWTIDRYKDLFGLTPEAVVADYHPQYFSSQYGKTYSEEHNVPYIQVQHHHAHVAAVMAEYGLDSEPCWVSVSMAPAMVLMALYGAVSFYSAKVIPCSVWLIYIRPRYRAVKRPSKNRGVRRFGMYAINSAMIHRLGLSHGLINCRIIGNCWIL